MANEKKVKIVADYTDLSAHLSKLRDQRGMYVWVDKATNKVLYIGQSINLHKRMYDYVNYDSMDRFINDKKGSHVNFGLGQILELNPTSVKVCIMIADDITRDQLNFWERWHIASYAPLFNETGNPRFENSGIHLLAVTMMYHSGKKRWQYNDLVEYIFNFYKGEIDRERIALAIKDDKNHLAKAVYQGHQVVRTRHKQVEDKEYYIRKKSA